MTTRRAREELSPGELSGWWVGRAEVEGGPAPPWTEVRISYPACCPGPFRSPRQAPSRRTAAGSIRPRGSTARARASAQAGRSGALEISVERGSRNRWEGVREVVRSSSDGRKGEGEEQEEHSRARQLDSSALLDDVSVAWLAST